MCGETPISYVVIHTHLGYRAYAEKELRGVFDLTGQIADGMITADGSEMAGSESSGCIEKSGRVVSFGSFERTLQSKKDDVLAAYSGKQIQHISLEMDNSDRYFAQLIAKEPFIGRSIKYYVGFEDDPQAEHLSIFTGVISEMSVLPILTIEADER